MKELSADRITTSRLLTLIRGARSAQEVTAIHGTQEEQSFKDLLYDLKVQKGLTPKEMIRRCGIERSYFYHILNGVKHPSRNVVLRLCLSAEADVQQANRLLRLADTPSLYAKVRRDALLIYALQHKYSMEQTNQMLREQEEAPLIRDESNA